MRVSHNQLLRYLLERQGLLERLPLSEASKFGPFHATDQTTPYLSLLARTDLQKWEQFADMYYDDRAYSRLRCMRGTLHLVQESHTDTVQCVYRLGEQDPYPEFIEYNISMDLAVRMRFAILQALAQEGSQSSTSLKHYVPNNLIQSHQNKYGGETTTIGPVLRWLWSLGHVESGIGVSDWRHRDNHFRISTNPPAPCNREQAEHDLARWYFSLYGPAAYEDWAWWSGLNKDRSKPAFDALKDELTEVAVEGFAEQMWMLHPDARILQHTGDSLPQMVRLLPYEDALLKAYKATRYRFYDETQVAGEAAFNKTGEAYPTIWVDGRIIGLWTWNRKPNEPMTIEIFEQITRDLRKRMKTEVDRVSEFVEASHVLWNF